VLKLSRNAPERHTGSFWKGGTPYPNFWRRPRRNARLNDDQESSCVHFAANTNRIYGARLWATCNLQAVWLNVALLSRRSRQRKRLHATGVSICSSSCVSPKCKKTRVSQKLSNLELRCPLTNYRAIGSPTWAFQRTYYWPLKSKMAEIRHFGCWRQNAKTRFSGKLSNLVSCK